MKKKFLAVLKYMLFLSVGLFLLWLALRGLDFEQIGQELRQAKYSWLLFSLVPGFIAHLSRTARWNIMINAMGYKTTFGSTFHAIIMGYFANTIFPRLGEVTRCTVLGNRQNIPVNRLFGTVISERVFDLICLGIISFFVVIAQFGFLRGFLEKMIVNPLTTRLPANVWLLSGLGLGVLLAFVLFLILLKISMPVIRKLSFYNKLKDLIIGFIEGIKSIKNLKRKWAFIGHTVIIWFSYLLMSFIPFRAFHATEFLTIIDGTTLLVMGSLGFVFPVPGGIGAYHWIVSRTLTDLYGIVSETAASYALLTHASQLLLIVSVGVGSIFFFMITKKKPLNVNVSSNNK